MALRLKTYQNSIYRELLRRLARNWSVQRTSHLKCQHHNHSTRAQSSTLTTTSIRTVTSVQGRMSHFWLLQTLLPPKLSCNHLINRRCLAQVLSAKLPTWMSQRASFRSRARMGIRVITSRDSQEFLRSFWHRTSKGVCPKQGTTFLDLSKLVTSWLIRHNM